jgi:hypothetical protein
MISAGALVRHNAVLQALCSLAGQAGMTAIKEPRGEFPETEKRPDATLTGITVANVRPLLVDVSVTHPAGDTALLRGAARTALHAATDREKEKHGKYDDLAADEGVDFVPVVFESFGAPGAEVKKVVARMAAEADTLRSSLFGDDGAAGFSRHAYTTLSVALQVGNALMHNLYARATRSEATASYWRAAHRRSGALRRAGRR